MEEVSKVAWTIPLNMTEQRTDLPEDVTAEQTQRVEAQPQLVYPDQRIEVEGFVRMDGEKTIAYFPDPPNITNFGTSRVTELTDDHKKIIEKALGRKHNREYWSPDRINGEIVVRMGVQYDLIVPETGETIRHRDIREGQEEAMRRRNGDSSLLQDRQSGNGIPHSDQTPRQESS